MEGGRISIREEIIWDERDEVGRESAEEVVRSSPLKPYKTLH